MVLKNVFWIATQCARTLSDVNKIKIPVLVSLFFPLSPSFALPEDIR